MNRTSAAKLLIGGKPDPDEEGDILNRSIELGEGAAIRLSKDGAHGIAVELKPSDGDTFSLRGPASRSLILLFRRALELSAKGSY